MILENYVAGPIVSYIVTGLFFFVLIFFILNELGFIRETEDDEVEDIEEFEDRKI